MLWQRVPELVRVGVLQGLVEDNLQRLLVHLHHHGGAADSAPEPANTRSFFVQGGEGDTMIYIDSNCFKY